MKASTLRRLGISTTCDIPADILLSSAPEDLPGALSPASLRKLSTLKDFLSEYRTEHTDGRIRITCSQLAARLLKERFLNAGTEELWIMTLDKGNRVTSTVRLTTGAWDNTNIDVRMVAASALSHRAAGVIIAHNHPSGDPAPSESDIRATETVHKGLTALGITLTDHIIICDDSYFSFHEEKKFNYDC